MSRQAGGFFVAGGGGGGEAGSNTLGMSNLGNTSGTTGVVSGSALRYLFAGGDNITLSQSISGVSATLTISGGAGAAAGSNTFGMSNLGNTSGTTGVVSGSAIRYLFAGGNNITLSQSLDAGNVSGTITISAFNQTSPVVSNALQTVGSATGSGTNTSRFAADDHVHAGVGQFQISGNTSNTSNIVFGSLVLAGGNNVTLSQVSAAGAATITISAANETQTVPPIGTSVQAVASASSVGTITRFAPEDHRHAGIGGYGASNTGNTAGNTGTSAGTWVLAGTNNVTVSESTGAAGVHTLWLSAPNVGAGNVTFSAGTSSAGLASLVFSNSNGVSFGLNGSTMTASVAAAGGAPTLSYFNNLNPDSLSSFNTSNATAFVFPLMAREPFPGNMTVSTLMLNLSGNLTDTKQSSSHTYSVSVGFYTLNGSTLSLLNSGSTSWGFSAATSVTANYHGPRWLTMNSSLFSTDLTFSQAPYWMLLNIQSSNLAVPMSWFGQRAYHTATRSGTLGTSLATATTLKWNYFLGRTNASITSVPATIEASQLRGEDAATYPMVVFNNLNSIW